MKKPKFKRGQTVYFHDGSWVIRGKVITSFENKLGVHCVVGFGDRCLVFPQDSLRARKTPWVRSLHIGDAVVQHTPQGDRVAIVQGFFSDGRVLFVNVDQYDWEGCVDCGCVYSDQLVPKDSKPT